MTIMELHDGWKLVNSTGRMEFLKRSDGWTRPLVEELARKFTHRW